MIILLKSKLPDTCKFKHVIYEICFLLSFIGNNISGSFFKKCKIERTLFISFIQIATYFFEIYLYLNKSITIMHEYQFFCLALFVGGITGMTTVANAVLVRNNNRVRPDERELT